MVEKRIVDFIKRHNILTLATVSEKGEPYCATCVYIYDKERNLFIFNSEENTRHAQEMMQNANVACAIALETRIIGKIQGVQICGQARLGEERDRDIYLKHYPFAAMMPLKIWVIEPSFIKLTDNTLGFGKKLIWNSQE